MSSEIPGIMGTLISNSLWMSYMLQPAGTPAAKTPRVQERPQACQSYNVRVENQNVGQGNSWTIIVGNGKTENIILRCESQQIANHVKDNFITALKTLNSGQKPKITIELDKSWNLILKLNGIQLRSIGVKNTSAGRLGDMSVWAKNLKEALKLNINIDANAIAQARLYKKAQPRFGRRWILGQWDCTGFVHYLLPKLSTELGGRGAESMHHQVSGGGIKPLSSPADAKQGDVILVILNNRGSKVDSHGYLALCIGKNKNGQNEFLNLENNKSDGTWEYATVGKLRYSGSGRYNTIMFALDNSYVQDPYYSMTV